MPGGDRTGPMGEGPLTGGGFGYCETTPIRRFSRGIFRGRQGGFGCGRGRRNRYWATRRTGWQRAGGWEDPMQLRDASAERRDPQHATAALEAELQRLRARIEELETPNSD
jgi:hypothetical protein